MDMRQLESLLEHLGVEQLKWDTKGVECSALCPLHMETRRSFSVNLEKKLFNCYGCGASGSLAFLVMQVKKMRYKDAKNYLTRFGHEETGIIRDFLSPRKKERVEPLPALSFYAAYTSRRRIQKAREYMEFRGVVYRKNGTLTKTGHEIGFDPKLYRVLFPWYDFSENFRGCTSRFNFNPKSRELVRYLPYFGLKKGEHLFFGKRHWKPEEVKAYAIVEGEIDAMLVSQLYPETGIVAFGLGEARATKTQLALLNRLGGPYLIGLDNDEAGRKMVPHLLEGLKNSVTTVLTWPKKDPGECSRKEILSVLRDRNWLLGKKELQSATRLLHSSGNIGKGGKEEHSGKANSYHGAVHQTSGRIFAF